MENAKNIVTELQFRGFEAVFAGGCVRDMILGLKPKDIDIATSASPDEVESIFKHTIPVGKQFGVVRVMLNGEEFEVATFRTDSKDGDGRRPDSVEFSSMEEDAKRRDLTINALFFDPIKEEIFDFVGGREDLKNGVIRFVGNPIDRIEEDKLRMLRAIRFAAHLQFDIEDNDIKFTLRDNAHRVMGNVSMERIKDEMEKMLLCNSPVRAMNMMKGFGLMKFIVPELERLDFSQQSTKWHSEGNVWVHTMGVLKEVAKNTRDIDVLWAALFHDIAKPHCMKIHEDGHISNHGHEALGVSIFGEIANRMKFSTKSKEKIGWLIKNHMKAHIAQQMKTSTVRKFINEEHFDSLLILTKADSKASIPDDKGREDHKEAGIVFLEVFKTTDEALPKPLISGRDLISEGLKPGEVFKFVLSDIFDLQLEGKISTKEEAIVSAKKIHKAWVS